MSDRVSSPASPLLPASQQQQETANVKVEVEETSTLPTPPPPIPGVTKIEPDTSAPSSSPTRRKTEGQRRAVLRNDPQVQEVEPQRVLCRICQKWIRLSGISNYVTTNWQAHKQRCTVVTPALRSTPSKPFIRPGGRVATAERRFMLLNDPRVKACSPKRVQCGKCMSVVTLGGEVDYELTKWNEHKKICIPVIPAPITPQGHTSHRSHEGPPPSSSSTRSRLSADGFQRSSSPTTPLGESSSNRSTATTAVAESSPVVVKAGTKRVREEEPEGEGEREDKIAEDVRPTIRPRKETYVRPPGDAPSALGWFMEPLKEFVRGFREGLGST